MLMNKFKKIRRKHHMYLKLAPNIRHLCYQPKYELKRIKWEFNPYDTDTNPNLSIPHGDDYYPTAHTLKLNVNNGRIYTARNRRYEGKVCKKELDRLHQDPNFISVKEKAIRFRNGEIKATQFKSENDIYRCELMVIKKR